MPGVLARISDEKCCSWWLQPNARPAAHLGRQGKNHQIAVTHAIGVATCLFKTQVLMKLQGRFVICSDQPHDDLASHLIECIMKAKQIGRASCRERVCQYV